MKRNQKLKMNRVSLTQYLVLSLIIILNLHISPAFCEEKTFGIFLENRSDSVILEIPNEVLLSPDLLKSNFKKFEYGDQIELSIQNGKLTFAKASLGQSDRSQVQSQKLDPEERAKMRNQAGQIEMQPLLDDRAFYGA